jgi:hypothetical protein
MENAIDCSIWLPSVFAGPISWYTKLLANPHVCICTNETYERKSARNRCNILSSTGVQTLTIPLKGGRNGQHTTGLVEIDLTKNWQRVHWQTFQTCYGKSPYFEYYQEKLAKAYQHPTVLLVDFNALLHNEICGLLQIPNTPVYKLNSLSRSLDVPENKDLEVYWQVFSDRIPFQQNLSILDLLFNLGPEARNYLQKMAHRMNSIECGGMSQ